MFKEKNLKLPLSMLLTYIKSTSYMGKGTTQKELANILNKISKFAGKILSSTQKSIGNYYWIIISKI